MGRGGNGGGVGVTVGMYSILLSANTDGITAGARMGIAISTSTIAECENNDSGSVYHLRLPIEIDWRVTSPNKSRGMVLSFCLIALARPGQRVVK
jgi:hypothetical protein